MAQKTPATARPIVSTTKHIKQFLAMAGGLIQLAGFPLSLFNRKELIGLKRDVESESTKHRFIASKVEETFLRMNNFSLYTVGQGQLGFK